MLLFEIADFTAPEVSEAEAEVLSTDSAQVRFRLEDPDGDVVQLLFTFFLNGTQTTVREVNSPEDVDLTGLTSGTITGTFTGLTVNPFELRPNEVRIVALDATGELTPLILADSARIQMEDARHANRKGYSKHSPALPLYDTAAANKAVKLLRTNLKLHWQGDHARIAN